MGFFDDIIDSVTDAVNATQDYVEVGAGVGYTDPVPSAVELVANAVMDPSPGVDAGVGIDWSMLEGVGDPGGSDPGIDWGWETSGGYGGTVYTSGGYGGWETSGGFGGGIGGGIDWGSATSGGGWGGGLGGGDWGIAEPIIDVGALFPTYPTIDNGSGGGFFGDPLGTPPDIDTGSDPFGLGLGVITDPGPDGEYHTADDGPVDYGTPEPTDPGVSMVPDGVGGWYDENAPLGNLFGSDDSDIIYDQDPGLATVDITDWWTTPNDDVIDWEDWGGSGPVIDDGDDWWDYGNDDIYTITSGGGWGGYDPDPFGWGLPSDPGGLDPGYGWNDFPVYDPDPIQWPINSDPGGIDWGNLGSDILVDTNDPTDFYETIRDQLAQISQQVGDLSTQIADSSGTDTSDDPSSFGDSDSEMMTAAPDDGLPLTAQQASEDGDAPSAIVEDPFDDVLTMSGPTDLVDSPVAATAVPLIADDFDDDLVMNATSVGSESLVDNFGDDMAFAAAPATVPSAGGFDDGSGLDLVGDLDSGGADLQPAAMNFDESFDDQPTVVAADTGDFGDATYAAPADSGGGEFGGGDDFNAPAPDPAPAPAPAFDEPDAFTTDIAGVDAAQSSADAMWDDL